MCGALTSDSQGGTSCGVCAPALRRHRRSALLHERWIVTILLASTPAKSQASSVLSVPKRGSSLGRGASSKTSPLNASGDTGSNSASCRCRRRGASRSRGALDTGTLPAPPPEPLSELESSPAPPESPPERVAPRLPSKLMAHGGTMVAVTGAASATALDVPALLDLSVRPLRRMQAGRTNLRAGSSRKLAITRMMLPQKRGAFTPRCRPASSPFKGRPCPLRCSPRRAEVSRLPKS